MNYFSLNDHCLKSGFKMRTNLCEISGENVYGLIQSLSTCSMQQPNMKIIERILYKNPQLYSTSESIKSIMRKDHPVISAFTSLGNYGVHCNVGWLIRTLIDIGEFLPMRNLLETAPPIISLRSPKDTVMPGDIIEFKVDTISEAQIQWWRHYDGRADIVQDHIRISRFSSVIVPFATKETDKGYFYIEVMCKGGFRDTSPWVYVGKDKITEDEKWMYQSLNKKKVGDITDTAKAESNSVNEQRFEMSSAIVPSPESDGIKRVALLIGIMDYGNTAIPHLKAPETDICDLERVLLTIGFTTYCFRDLVNIQMIHVLEQFCERCIEENAYVFFYFAGHGRSEGQVDYLQLDDIHISVLDVLRILIRKKPKVLVSIFDMCRDDKNEPVSNSGLLEAKIPVSENLILVMSTLPTKKSFEKSSGFENTSLIMKPLCENLSKFACISSINLVLNNFLNSFDNVAQIPMIAGVGIPQIIGVDTVIPRIKPNVQWLQVPEDQQILRSISVDFKIFHNILNIYIDKNLESKNFEAIIQLPDFKERSRVQLQSDNCGNYKINLFQLQKTLKMAKALQFDLCVVTKMPVMYNTRYTIKVNIPDAIIPFLLFN